MLRTWTIRVAFALILLIAPALFTLATGRGLWGVRVSGFTDLRLAGMGLEYEGQTDFHVCVLTFALSVAVSISGLILLLHQMRRI
jgi:hypothetical protein